MTLTQTSAPAMSDTQPSLLSQGPLIHDEVLGILSKQLDDIEGLRKATSNRLGALTRSEPDEDGVVRGLELGEDHLAVKQTKIMLESLDAIEHQTVLALQKQMRKHPLGPFIKSKKGVGDKQAARLLAAIGDPYWMTRFEKQGTNHVMVESRPRTVSELWAYCGYSVTEGHSQRRTKGKLSNWKNDARMRAYLVSTSIIKQMDSEYREVYDYARLKYSVAVDAEGKALTLLHQHNRALRAVSKELLKDLWVEAKRLHEEAAGN
jgi:hypothetical protein